MASKKLLSLSLALFLSVGLAACTHEETAPAEDSSSSAGVNVEIKEGSSESVGVNVEVKDPAVEESKSVGVNVEITDGEEESAE